MSVPLVLIIAIQVLVKFVLTVMVTLLVQLIKIHLEFVSLTLTTATHWLTVLSIWMLKADMSANVTLDTTEMVISNLLWIRQAENAELPQVLDILDRNQTSVVCLLITIS
jgi:hypothetical protein